jgi:hypothetical protein
MVVATVRIALVGGDADIRDGRIPPGDTLTVL